MLIEILTSKYPSICILGKWSNRYREPEVYTVPVPVLSLLL